MRENNNCCDSSCYAEVLETILALQVREEKIDCIGGCQKPFLGSSPDGCFFNTRPITLYCCCADRRWTFPATVNGREVPCDVFRIENLNNCCATFRCLVPNTCNDTHDNGDFMATEDFFTIDLACVSALKCLEDTRVAGL